MTVTEWIGSFWFWAHIVVLAGAYTVAYAINRYMDRRSK